MYACQTEQFLMVRSKHSITWSSQQVRCAWRPNHHTQEYLYIKLNTEQGRGHTNWMKMLAMLISRKTSLDVWNINSNWTDRCRILLVKATSISILCCTSMVHVLTISHDRDQDIMLKHWISSQIWLDISLKWSHIQHNWSEIVTGNSSPDLLSWTMGGNAWANGLHLCHHPQHCMPSLGYSDGV